MKKLILFLTIIGACAGAWFLRSKQVQKPTYTTPTAQPNPIRRLLCYLRGGDYVHPGDEKAIHLVMQQALILDPALRDKKTLDVGCGFGGTMQYLARRGFKDICGIDNDAPSVAYARSTYPQFKFFLHDALSADTCLKPHSISFFTLFSVIYAIEDKQKLLHTLSHLATPGAVMAIWDYTYPNPTMRISKDANNSFMHAIISEQLRESLDKAGWDLASEQDWTRFFVESYTITLQQLEEQKATLEELFTPKVVEQTRTIYTAIKNNVENGELGGTLILAVKRS